MEFNCGTNHVDDEDEVLGDAETIMAIYKNMPKDVKDGLMRNRPTFSPDIHRKAFGFVTDERGISADLFYAIVITLDRGINGTLIYFDNTKIIFALNANVG